MNNNEKLGQLAADTIRMLAADTIQKANSGHPGLPMGMADCAYVLWMRFLKHTPNNPDWINRDRFILSGGHGSALLYTMLHLSGYEYTLDDLKEFRQWRSKTPGHPEIFLPGVEVTTGPLGQGFASGVGMAIAAKMTASRFETELLGTHRVFSFCGDGDMMEGLTAEAASLAGHLGLGNLVYFYDSNSITIEGNTEIAFSEDVKTRFQSYNWHVLEIDGHNHIEIAEALEQSIAEKNKPSLIIAKTHIGFGSPNKQDTAGVHGAPLGEEELKATKRNLGLPEDEKFFVPEEVRKIFICRNGAMQSEYNEWKNTFAKWEEENPELADRFNAMLDNTIPENLEEELLQILPDQPMATRAISGKALQKIAELTPGFCGGSADLAPSNKSHLNDYESISMNNFTGRNFHFGVREHAMGAILNGIALYGGYIPFGGTFLVFSDYMRPAIRLAALMKANVKYIFTHDSIFVGEDGPTHQPVEQIAALRTIPNSILMRPADAMEVAMCWAKAVRYNKGPVSLALTRQNLAPLKRSENFDPRDIQKGAYIISPERTENPDIIIVATGSEVALAIEAQKELENSERSIRVVSMPSREIFQHQTNEYQISVIPKSGFKLIVIELGVTIGWHDLSEMKTLVIGLDKFGDSAPYSVLADKYGFTPEKIVAKIENWLE